jgi:anti-sigma B factor antagonist
MTLELSVCVHDAYAVAAARGELDVTSSAGAISAIAGLAARHPVVIVELSAAEFMDCGALGALLRVQRLARQSGGDVLLAAPAAIVLRLLSLTGMDEVFGVHASADAAVASIAGSPVAGGASRQAERAGCSVVGTSALSGPSR